jgi:hypothetical protein
MINLNDEILNKYIDNELSSVELAEVKAELNKNEEALIRLRALRLVDSSLRKMEHETAPENFTEKIMQALANVPKTLKPKGSYFFALIITIFSIGILAIFIAGFRMTDTANNETLPAVTSLNQAKNYIDKNINVLLAFLTNQNVLFVLSMLSLILLVAVYFSIESYKSFKNKLNSIPN